MNLILKDGTDLVCADNSTVSEIIMFFDTVTSFSGVYSELSEENLSEFTLNNVNHTDRIVTEVSCFPNHLMDYIEAHFKTETSANAARIESLTNQLAQYKDKADAYDILVNGYTQNTEI